jgi:hypothetical protein
MNHRGPWISANGTSGPQLSQESSRGDNKTLYSYYSVLTAASPLFRDGALLLLICSVQPV